MVHHHNILVALGRLRICPRYLLHRLLCRSTVCLHNRFLFNNRILGMRTGWTLMGRMYILGMVLVGFNNSRVRRLAVVCWRHSNKFRRIKRSFGFFCVMTYFTNSLNLLLCNATSVLNIIVQFSQAMIIRVISMTPDQIRALPPAERSSVVHLVWLNSFYSFERYCWWHILLYNTSGQHWVSQVPPTRRHILVFRYIILRSRVRGRECGNIFTW